MCEKQDPDDNNALHVSGVNIDCLRLNWDRYDNKASSKYTGDLYALFGSLARCESRDFDNELPISFFSPLTQNEHTCRTMAALILSGTEIGADSRTQNASVTWVSSGHPFNRFSGILENPTRQFLSYSTRMQLCCCRLWDGSAHGPKEVQSDRTFVQWLSTSSLSTRSNNDSCGTAVTHRALHPTVS